MTASEPSSMSAFAPKGDVIDLQAAGIGVAQDHVWFGEAAEIADTRELPIQADRAALNGAVDTELLVACSNQLAGQAESSDDFAPIGHGDSALLRVT